jgi:ATP adenylyltransferase
LFCRTGASVAAEQQAGSDPENFVVWRGVLNFVILNRYPYSTGHVMIAPYQHAPTLEDAATAALEENIRMAQKVEAALREIYRPEGFNLGFNIGKCAGAGIAGHIHLHILPRWNGDTSFVTTVGETRVLPEDLPTTYRKLRMVLAKN